MDAKRRDLALLIYGSLNFDARGRIKLTPSVSFDRALLILQIIVYYFCVQVLKLKPYMKIQHPSNNATYLVGENKLCLRRHCFLAYHVNETGK